MQDALEIFKSEAETMTADDRRRKTLAMAYVKLYFVVSREEVHT